MRVPKELSAAFTALSHRQYPAFHDLVKAFQFYLKEDAKPMDIIWVREADVYGQHPPHYLRPSPQQQAVYEAYRQAYDAAATEKLKIVITVFCVIDAHSYCYLKVKSDSFKYDDGVLSHGVSFGSRGIRNPPRLAQWWHTLLLSKPDSKDLNW